MRAQTAAANGNIARLAAALIVTCVGVASAVAAAPAHVDSVRAALLRGEYRLVETDARRLIEGARGGGEAAPDSLEAMDLLAWAVFRLGRYAEAESLARVTVAARVTQGESVALAIALGTLANVRRDRGDPEEAVSLARRALAIAERVPGVDDLEVARVREALANALMDRGDLDEAALELETTLAIRRRRLGSEDLLVARTLHNLAIGRRRQGELTQARRLYEESLAIRERILGPDNVDVAWSLHNLSNVMFELGEFPEVRRLQERALGIRERVLGPDHPDVAFSLMTLANTMMELGDLEVARRMHERALAIHERVGGPMHVEVARSLNNLGLACARLGQYARADSLYRRSIAIREKALGVDHSQVAISLFRLSHLREVMGDTAEARAITGRVLAIDRARLGPDHFETAGAHLHLAEMSWRAGHVDAALSEALQAEGISRRHFRRMVRGLDERGALRFSGYRISGLDLLLEMAAAPAASGSLESIVMDALVRSRALVLGELAVRRRVVAAAEGDSDTRRLALGAAEMQSRLAQLVLRGPQKGNVEAFGAELAAEERAVGLAQRALAERSAVHRQLGLADEVGLAEVQRAFPAGTALVSIARYAPIGPRGPVSAPAPDRYVAFVTRGAPPRAVRVALGSAADLDRVIDRWLALAGRPSNPLRRAADARACREAGRRVRQRLWDPIATALAGATRVVIVPDGAAALVPWAALPLADGRYLVEDDVVVHQVATEREVIEFALPREPGRGLLAFGGVDYGARGAPAGAGRSRGEQSDFADGSTKRGSPCISIASRRFAELPGSAAEVEAIRALWFSRDSAGGAEVRTGAAADERSMRQLAPGRRVLHLATHGFFVEKACAITAAESGDPLCRSGIVLAGTATSAADSARSDGLVTAAEIAAFDLSGVEWAVLSACRTGLGEIVTAEGVLGLRRALRIAGAATVITSLWEVDDRSVREWMEALYRARLERGLDTADAMRAASLAVLKARRARGLGDHPRDWAAFVAVGDWR